MNTYLYIEKAEDCGNQQALKKQSRVWAEFCYFKESNMYFYIYMKYTIGRQGKDRKLMRENLSGGKSHSF